MSDVNELKRNTEDLASTVDSKRKEIEVNKEAWGKLHNLISETIHGIASETIHCLSKQCTGMYSSGCVDIWACFEGPYHTKGTIGNQIEIPGARWRIDYTGNTPAPIITKEDILNAVNEGLKKLKR